MMLRRLGLVLLTLAVLVIAAPTAVAWPGGSWGWSGTPTSGAAPGTSGWNTAWYAATDIYWDPGNTSTVASDGNGCTTSGAPCLTWGEITRRFGGTSVKVNYGQNVTIHLMSSQPSGADPVEMMWFVSGGSMVIFDGLLGMTAAGANFGAGTLGGGFGYSGAVASAGGTQMTIGSAPAYALRGTLLENTTRTSYAFVDNLVSTTISATQPQTKGSLTTYSSPAGVVDNDWVAADTIAVWNLPTVNLKSWIVYGDDQNTVTGGALVRLQILDSAGSSSSFALEGHGNYVSSCVWHRGVTRVSGVAGRGVTLMNTLHSNNLVFQTGPVAMYGGAAILGANLRNNTSPTTNLTNNVCLHSTVNVQGIISASNVFSDGSVNVLENGTLDVTGGMFWGSYSGNVAPMALWENQSGSTFVLAATLTNGALTIDGAGTGSTGIATGTFTLNGVTAVNVTGSGVNQFPANATISLSLNTVGSTPGTGAPFFATTAITANQFTVKSPTASCNDVYNWSAGPTAGVSITPANLDKYNGLQNVRSGGRYSNGT